MKIFDEIESEVQCYARAFPRLFNKAQGEYLYDNEGNQYLDFLAGAGTLNYGHNNPVFKKKLIEYIEQDGITHGLDLHTKAKGEFLNTFNYTDIINPNGSHHFNFKININEYKLVIFLFTSHIRDNSKHLIDDMLISADKVFTKFEEKGIKVCTLCWMPEFFDNSTYRQHYVNKNRHTPLIYNGETFHWYEDLCQDMESNLTVKSDFAKKGYQRNDIHFNKEGNMMMAESIIKKLNREKFSIIEKDLL